MIESRLLFQIVIGIIFLSSVKAINLLHSSDVDGNEIQAANYYFNMTHNSFDEVSYYNHVQQCFSKPLAGMRGCIQPLHNTIFPKMRIWGDHNHNEEREVDCLYEVSAKSWRSHPSSENSSMILHSYHLTISQTSCKSNVKIAGGSSFIITAYSDDHLVGCRYKDTFDNYYHVICAFHKHQGELNAASALPSASSHVNVTILLEYEHFDGFSESLTGEASLFLNDKYNSLRHLVANNQMYRFDYASASHNMRHNEEDSASKCPCVS